MDEATPPLRGRYASALQACALYPRGMRRAAYPTAMPMLRDLGLVVEQPALFAGRRRGETAWFMTRAGRTALEALSSRNRR